MCPSTAEPGSRAVVQRIEQGTGAPGLRQLWRIASVLGVPVHALLTAQDDPPTG
jgi:transcriptional regulator with XRE-family HTH domain